MSESIKVEISDGIALLLLNEPQTRNALSASMRLALETQVPDIVADPCVRAIVISGNGDAFCGGGDLRSFVDPQAPIATRDRIARSHRWLRALLTTEKPVITAVNGAAIGAGFGLALVGDIVLVGNSAFFQPGFSLVGVVADYALGLTLPRAVGEPRAKDILLTNRRVDATEAATMGMASRLIGDEDLLEEAMATAKRLVRGPLRSLGLTKTLIARSRESSLDGYLDAEAIAQAIAFSTDDFREGVAAFLGKRRAAFRGQ